MSDASFHAGESSKTDLCNTQLRAAHALTNTESSIVTSFGKPISRIRFYAQVPRFRQASNQVRARLEVCEFSLGLGPCGRTVTRLWYRIDGDFLKITQECAHASEGECEVKDFIYLIREISGRVAVTSM